MSDSQKARIAKLWGGEWHFTVEQIHKYTGHSPKLIKTYLVEAGLWEDRRKGAVKKTTPKRKTEVVRHSEIYSR